MKNLKEKVQVIKTIAVQTESKKVVKQLTEAQKLQQVQKLKAQNVAIEFLGTKIVNGKVLSPPKRIIKAQTTIELYIDKENRTINEVKLLTNALSKTDCLSASKVFDKLINNTLLLNYCLELSGRKDKPTFKEFVSLLPVKFAYSEWDLLGAMAKMNPKHKINAKIERQNKSVKAK